MRLCTLINKQSYNDHFIYFVLIFFTVAFCVMSIYYFSFLNVDFRLNNVWKPKKVLEWKYFILSSISSL